MRKEYAIIIAKIDGEHIFQLRKGDEIIESITWEESMKIGYVGAFLLKKYNIPYEAAGYSCSE